MENKYYTPELKEFYIGFEYEYLALGLYEDGPEPFWGWYKRTYEDDENYIFTEKRDESFLRVKYLDQQDIESLGWKYTPTKGSYTLFTKDNLELRVNDEPWVNGDIDILAIGALDYFIFRGIVKNKSELKRLMDMLQINP